MLFLFQIPNMTCTYFIFQTYQQFRKVSLHNLKQLFQTEDLFRNMNIIVIGVVENKQCKCYRLSKLGGSPWKFRQCSGDVFQLPKEEGWGWGILWKVRWSLTNTENPVQVWQADQLLLRKLPTGHRQGWGILYCRCQEFRWRVSIVNSNVIWL